MNWESRFVFKRTPLDIPLLFFLVLSIISFVRAPYKHDSLMELYRLIAYYTIYYIIINNVDTRPKIIGIMVLLVGMGAFLSLIGIVLYLGHVPYQYWLPGESLSATYVNRDHFAGYLEMIMPLALGLLFTRTWREKKILVLFLLLIMALAFILAASRGAWASFATSCLILLPLFLRKKLLKRIILGCIICGTILYFALARFDLSLVISRLSTIAEGVGIDEMRIMIWQGTTGLIKVHPILGSGLGMFIYAFPQFRHPCINPYYLIDYAHNDYLHMAAELGLAGLFLIFWVICAALWAGFKEFYITPSTFRRGVSFGASVGIMSITLHSLVDFNLHIPANAIVFVVLLGLIMVLKAKKEL